MHLCATEDAVPVSSNQRMTNKRGGGRALPLLQCARQSLATRWLEEERRTAPKSIHSIKKDMHRRHNIHLRPRHIARICCLRPRVQGTQSILDALSFCVALLLSQ